ncbi:MAG TPA: hypothetical protein VKZ79_22545 [Alphaproteobacteria bacterium]|nr:hypothetical protein [Alphaproteobacteria bacterium]
MDRRISPAEAIRGYATTHQSTAIKMALAVVLVLYTFLITHGNFNLFNETWMGLAFNSMVVHLSHGQFDVDPDKILFEGFVHDGKTYSYYGVFFALIRLPILLFERLQKYNFTLISCLMADLIVVYCQAKLVLKCFKSVERPSVGWLFIAAMALTLFSGPQVYLLRPSIYQEVAYWALALTYLFVYVLLDIVLFERQATTGRLFSLSLLAGLALLARVATGIGLYVTVVAALVTLVRRSGTPRSSARYWVPLLTLALFAAATGFVNYMRWGHPFEFMDPHNDLSYSEASNPGAIARIDRYGTFNFIRLGYGLLYYFLPLWMIRQSDGTLLFSEFHHRTIDMVELPPSSFFITDPIWLALAIYMLVCLVRSWSSVKSPLAVTVLGFCLAIPGAGMLLYMAYAVRYRVDFYPAIMFMAFLGLHRFLRRDPKAGLPGRSLPWVWPLAAMSVLSAPVLLLLYYASPFGGNVDGFARDGWIRGYMQHISAAVAQGAR